jgi:hypothetical protein
MTPEGGARIVDSIEIALGEEGMALTVRRPGVRKPKVS